MQLKLTWKKSIMLMVVAVAIISAYSWAVALEAQPGERYEPLPSVPSPTVMPSLAATPSPTPTPTPTATPTSTASPTAAPIPTAPPLPTPTPSPISQQVVADSEGLRVVVPIYNNAGLEVARTRLSPYVHSGDILVLISGNFHPIDIGWLNESAAVLKAQYPGAVIMAGTSGLANVSALAEGATGPIEAIVYIYEPDFPNEPEFTWEFNATIANFKEVAQAARAYGLRIVGKPTGRPLLQLNLQQYGWDYAALAQHVDQMMVQTQTYCKKGIDTFDRAIAELADQYSVAGFSGLWSVQVTVDPDAPNGVAVSQAVECALAAWSRGVAALMVWWSPKYASAAVQFLQLIGR